MSKRNEWSLMKICTLSYLIILFDLLSLVTTTSLWAEQISLSKLELFNIRQDSGTPRAGRAVDNKPLRIGQVPFADGVSTHANSRCDILLAGAATRFHAFVGVDAEEDGFNGAVVFHLYGDNKVLYNSGIIRGGEGPKEVSVPLTGIKRLILSATSADPDTRRADVDWAAATIDYSKQTPQIVPVPVPTPYVLTPKPLSQPKINGAKIVGVHPGHPFLYTIAATGDRPISFAAHGLPTGLMLDERVGRITGSVTQPGKYKVHVTAANAHGTASRDLEIVVGNTIALTPALGWDPYNAFSIHVTQDTIRTQATAFVKSGLINHGFTYINIDDTWAQKPGSNDPYLGGCGRDINGNLLPNRNFSNITGLIDYVHSLGLKVGIYLSPGPLTCQSLIGSYKHELQDATLIAKWGIDYLKYDYCSYSEIEPNPSVDSRKYPYKLMGTFLESQPRDIYYALCEYGLSEVQKWGASVHGNSWRTTNDITDTWENMAGIGFNQAALAPYAGPGHWNDPDMLVVGWVGWGNARPTRLTPDEQYTHISLWSLLSAPLLIGCDLTRLDDFTLNLLTNDEVIDIDQDPLGKPVSRVVQHGSLEVWEKDLADGSKAVGLFNRRMFNATVSVSWEELGITGPQMVHDVWRQADLGQFDDQFSVKVPWHGVRLIKVSPLKGSRNLRRNGPQITQSRL